MNLDTMHTLQVFRLYGAFDFGTTIGGLYFSRPGDALSSVFPRYATYLYNKISI
ncbi:MAG: hypothetical protein IJ193_08040 [Bacilli bacterium]|nr:hypothetical protein [Bacilli bacterium]